jgi:segregation and condensation protein A
MDGSDGMNGPVANDANPDDAIGSPDDAVAFNAAPRISPDEALIIDVDGFEGPLDLLLALARDQKVDIAKISILKLADQYLAFMETARKHRLELAADYLVMAAWLAYLKSRLVLPQPEAEAGPNAEEMAAQLRWRLARLQAMREAAARLLARERLSRDVFARGAPEPVRVVRVRQYGDTLYDLLSAYSRERVRKVSHKVYELVRAPVFLIEDARLRLERMLGSIPDWNGITQFLPTEWQGGLRRRTALASTFSACLEMARDGKIVLRQLSPFGEIFIKDKTVSVEDGQ